MHARRNRNQERGGFEVERGVHNLLPYRPKFRPIKLWGASIILLQLSFYSTSIPSDLLPYLPYDQITISETRLTCIPTECISQSRLGRLRPIATAVVRRQDFS